MWQAAVDMVAFDALVQNPDRRYGNRALEGMNNKIKLVSHRSLGFRSAKNYIAAIYRCCAKSPCPIGSDYTFRIAAALSPDRDPRINTLHGG